MLIRGPMMMGLMALIMLAVPEGPDAKERQEFTDQAVWLSPATTWDGTLVVFFTGKNAVREPAAAAFEQRAQDGKFGASLMVCPLWDRHPDLEAGGDALGEIFGESPVTLDLTRLTYISQGRGNEQAQLELALHPGRRAPWRSLDAGNPEVLPAPWVLAKPGLKPAGVQPDLMWVDPRFADQGWAKVEEFEGETRKVQGQGKDGELDLLWLSRPATLVSRQGVLWVDGVKAFTLRSQLTGSSMVRIGKQDVEVRWKALDKAQQDTLRQRFGLEVQSQASFHLENGSWVPGS